MRNRASRQNLYSATVAASTLMLLASCGGGGEPCTNPTFCPAATTAASTPTTNPTPNSNTGSTSTTPTVQALTLAPSSITIGNCTTGVPFIFKGGQPPYTVFTSDNFSVPVSAPLPLDTSRSYFFADVHFARGGEDPKGKEVNSKVTVLDAQSQTAVAIITTPVTTDTCPADRPPFEALPESANFRTDEMRDFDLRGGTDPTAIPTVTFADAGVATVASATAKTVRVRAIATVSASTLMTIAASDGQRTSVVINVLPQPQ